MPVCLCLFLQAEIIQQTFIPHTSKFHGEKELYSKGFEFVAVVPIRANEETKFSMATTF